MVDDAMADADFATDVDTAAADDGTDGDDRTTAGEHLQPLTRLLLVLERVIKAVGHYVIQRVKDYTD